MAAVNDADFTYLLHNNIKSALLISYISDLPSLSYTMMNSLLITHLIGFIYKEATYFWATKRLFVKMHLKFRF